MKWPGRFEWKILAVVGLAAALAVGTAGYALRFALRAFVTYWQQERFAEDPGSRAAEVFRLYFSERKETFRRKTQEIASQPPPRLADLAGVEGLMRARLFEGRQVIDAWQAPPETLERLAEAPSNLEEVPTGPGAPPGQDPRALELTFGIPAAMYRGYNDLTRMLDLERQREDAYEAFVSTYTRQYVILVVVLMAVVPFFGLFFARRATRRVARLLDAAQRVGQGDLSVRLSPAGRDELDELARGFDGMVEELGEARARLAYLQKVAAWQEVARRLAHEIKNPLTPIQLAVQELASKYRGDDPTYRRLLDTAVEILKEEITGLRRLVEDFSAFAKLPKVDPKPLDLGEFLREFEQRHPEWKSVLEVAAPVGRVMAPCDRSLFARVLANLVENAVQAGEEGGIPPKVRLAVHTDAPRRRAVIVVDDNGPGVSSSDRHRVFDPYVTSKKEGTGLGLSIVRKIVIDHGGDIFVSSTPSPLGGARFTVEIPTEAQPPRSELEG